MVHGLPFYASSIAVSQKPELANVYAGMVVDLAHDVAYTAFEGMGAFRNGKKIETSRVVSLDDAVIGLDLNTFKAKEVVPKVTALIVSTKHIQAFWRQRA